MTNAREFYVSPFMAWERRILRRGWRSGAWTARESLSHETITSIRHAALMVMHCIAVRDLVRTRLAWRRRAAYGLVRAMECRPWLTSSTAWAVGRRFAFRSLRADILSGPWAPAIHNRRETRRRTV